MTGLTAETVEQLRTEHGHAVRAAAIGLQPTTARYPSCLDRLRKQYPVELARAALDLALLQSKAKLKFSRAESMLFDREGLEMASSEAVSSYRAERFRGYQQVADLCCGIGGDAIGLAAVGCQLIAIDHSPVRVAMTAANRAAYHLLGDCRVGDILQADLSGVEAVFVDPNRRENQRRHLDPEQYQPSVSAVLSRLKQFPLKLIGIKIAPGIAETDWQKYNTETEFISLHGELKEAVLWFEEGTRSTSRATVLPGQHFLDGEAPPAPWGEPEGWIYDPDPAVIRAQQLGSLAGRLKAHVFDEQIGLLSAPTCHHTPFARAYPLEHCLKYHPRKIEEWLRLHRVGRLTIVQRGSGLDTEKIPKQWKLKGDEHRILILTKVEGVPHGLICGESPLTALQETNDASPK